ncbi:hypothetical protein JHK82_045862 [Glycine max]|nr:hypothetical protein JHK82_045862 [Glycine max]
MKPTFSYEHFTSFCSLLPLKPLSLPHFYTYLFHNTSLGYIPNNALRVFFFFFSLLSNHPSPIKSIYIYIYIDIALEWKMAPRNSRGKPKGEKKKKEEKVLPVVIDITVKLLDETHVLKVRGPRLKDTVDVSALKPCLLTLVEEDYDEDRAVAHVRRLLDIVACTTSFGPSSLPPPKNDSGTVPKSGKPEAPPAKQSAKDAEAAAATVDIEGEISHSCPKLENFYEFFSLSHLTAPIQYVKRGSRRRVEEILEEDYLFSLDVKVCNGKVVHVEACRKGFYSVGKQRILCHNLVDLLRQLSRAFDNAFDDLLKAFSERNKFGNLPYGFRANTWLVPPVAAQSPSYFPPLPVEDEMWGGNGGGLGRDGKYDLVPWANEFSFIASMPCKTAEERQVRDRKAFLLHSLFVDVAIFRAIKAIKHVMEEPNFSCSVVENNIIYTERVGDLNINVLKDGSVASCKIDTKIDGVEATGVNQKDLLERNLMKGITADENTAAHDITTLGVINVRYCGYVVVVKVEGGVNENVDSPSQQNIELFDQPEGGANALNINSLRLLLHNTTSPENNKPVSQIQTFESEELGASHAFVEKLIKENLAKLEEEEPGIDYFVRWELGACWVQHLQDQNNTEKDKKPSSEKAKNEMKVEGLGKPLKALKNYKKKSDSSNNNSATEYSKFNREAESSPLPSIESQHETTEAENELVLKGMLSDEAFTRLKESGTGLHCKSMHDLIELSRKYYTDVALPKLVKLSEKLSHVQSLCIHEMIVRAFKHILRAVISAVDKEKMASSIAGALNLLLGVPENRESDKSREVHPLVWKWLELFLKKRFDWDLNKLNYKDVKKFAILRGLCHKVGIELVPRDFDMDSPIPFQKSDIVSLVPVHKATIYQQKALDINERELGLDHPDTMKSYGDLAVFYYRLQHTELALKYVKRALYLLHLTCGPSHPNTAATYINVAMMEEGLGNVHVALRYLHKALKCNQRLLGADHIQTAASYHAIAIALSLMEAYPLSVQHEQTTLQILRAKLGSDDLRTQDAAAWLEYFESKAFEQQEAARNGTRKPDASIASKGHLSVSDLLDYINPNTKGRDAAAKRRSQITKVRATSYQNTGMSSSDESSKEIPKEASDEEVQISEPVGSADSEQESNSGPDLEQAILKQISDEKLQIYDEIFSEAHAEGEDGWQSVQRPRSAGSYGRRLKQRRAALGKVYSYHKNVEVGTESPFVRSPNPNSRYYFLKKRTISHGSYTDDHTTNITQGNKFGRKVVKAVTYRVKSMPSTSKPCANETLENGDKLLSSLPEPDPIDANPVKNSKVSLGKSPSYKEVALAPPGTISKFQVYNPQSEISVSSEHDSGKHEEEVEANRNVDVDPTLIEVNDTVKEKNNDSLSDSVDDSLDDTGVAIEGKEETELIVAVQDNCMSAEGQSGDVKAQGAVDSSILIHAVDDHVDSYKQELDTSNSSGSLEPSANTNPISQGGEDLRVNVSPSSQIRTGGIPYKKLSASAAPFNPSPAIARAAPIAMNMTLPSGPRAVPAIGPWPVNMNVHPGPTTVLPAVAPMCSSPHHAYPSPPTTPNMMQPLPFMYPPFTQPQSVSPSNFPVTNSAFHANHFTYLNPTISKFGPSAVWPGCHPVEFPLPVPIVEPIPDPISESQALCHGLESPSSASVLPEDIDNIGDSNQVVKTLSSEISEDEAVRSGSESIKENGNMNFHGSENAGNKQHQNIASNGNSSSSGTNMDGEKTFSILFRGRRNRKQTLRMPISLLTRPNGSQSFKVIYNRVVRGSHAPKSMNLSSSKDCTATS